MTSSPSVVDPILHSLTLRLQSVATESVPWQESFGRVLASDVVADRDSPATDVSAMDGYAIRLQDIQSLPSQPIAVFATVTAGSESKSLPFHTAMRVFTGAPVPSEAECVVKREDALESDGCVQFQPTEVTATLGENIRRRGENCKKGSLILDAGSALTSVRIGAAVTFGQKRLTVYRRVRIAIVNTGDELRDVDAEVKPWQIRDSNGPSLEGFASQYDWLELVSRCRVADDQDSISQKLSQLWPDVDAVLLTGGVSMGDTDHVPHAIQAAGGEIIFHRVPIRPGRPLLGAVGPGGQLVMGLPGNPASVAVTARRFGLPLLRKLAGFRDIHDRCHLVQVVHCDTKSIPLTWYRIAKWIGPGSVELVDTQGSGDMVSLASSDGFVEIPAGLSGPGPWPWYPWG